MIETMVPMKHKNPPVRMVYACFHVCVKNAPSPFLCQTSILFSPRWRYGHHLPKPSITHLINLCIGIFQGKGHHQ